MHVIDGHWTPSDQYFTCIQHAWIKVSNNKLYRYKGGLGISKWAKIQLRTGTPPQKKKGKKEDNEIKDYNKVNILPVYEHLFNFSSSCGCCVSSDIYLTFCIKLPLYGCFNCFLELWLLSKNQHQSNRLYWVSLFNI